MLRDALDAFVRRDTDMAQDVLNEDDRLTAQDPDLPELLTYMLQDPAPSSPRSTDPDFTPPRAIATMHNIAKT